MESDGKIYKCINQISKKFKINEMKVLEIISRSFPNLNPSVKNLLDRKLDLVHRFIQPFDPDFTHVKDNEFITFTRSDKLRLIYTQTKFITIKPDFTMKFIDSIENINKDSICFTNFYFLSYNKSGFKKLNDKHGFKYLNRLLEYTNNSKILDFAFSIECLDNSFKFDRESTCHDVNIKNKMEIKKLKLCMKNKNVKYARLHLTFIVNSDTTKFITMEQGKTIIGHSAQLILDVHNNKAYILESSVNDNDLGSQQLETIKDISIEVFLKHYIDKNIKVEELDLSSCPVVKLQGNTGLCCTWSLYLFILTLLNPGVDRYIIYKIFSQYTQKERDIVIMMFMYWIFKYDKYKDINLKNELDEGVLPSL
jgi:hypothetical protein